MQNWQRSCLQHAMILLSEFLWYLKFLACVMCKLNNASLNC
jgi:hypothetical protein